MVCQPDRSNRRWIDGDIAAGTPARAAAAAIAAIAAIQDKSTAGAFICEEQAHRGVSQRMPWQVPCAALRASAYVFMLLRELLPYRTAMRECVSESAQEAVRLSQQLFAAMPASLLLSQHMCEPMFVALRRFCHSCLPTVGRVCVKVQGAVCR